MKIIKILPHHLPYYLDAYVGNDFKKYKFYNNHFKKEAIELANMVATNPSILVQIVVNQHDSFCQFCPKNRRSWNKSKWLYPTCNIGDKPINLKHPTFIKFGFF